MPELSPPDRRKMVAILSRLASDQAGEVMAAAHLATSMLRKSGISWDDLLTPVAPSTDAEDEDWRSNVVATLQYPGLLSPWEQRFLRELQHRRVITPRQRAKLIQIAQQLRERKAW